MSLAQSRRDHGVDGLELLLHYNCILGLNVAGVDGLHGLAEECGILETDDLDQLGFLAGAALDHHLVHAGRDGNSFQLVAILHLLKGKKLKYYY